MDYRRFPYRRLGIRAYMPFWPIADIPRYRKMDLSQGSNQEQVSSFHLRQNARRRLVGMIERLAVRERLSMCGATKRLLDDDDCWELLAAAVGANSRRARPTSRAVRSWFDQEKIRLAKAWPDNLPDGLSADEVFPHLEAYIPVKKRDRRPSRVALRGRALDLDASGMPRVAIAKTLGIARSTLYRLLADREPSVT